MECNKEEAFRAKTIAERKMQDRDFMGARKFALKAQQLYPDAENIFQMICVCDVHCAADKKISGNELDWYGILQIEQTADDALIKKQYRKFALLLHPDKNQFAGAEAAFKLIGEAQRVLLDKDKRSFFDMKYKMCYRVVIPKQASKQASRSVNISRQSRVQKSYSRNPISNVKGFNPPKQEPKQQVHPEAASRKETFWTVCPSCSIQYQYFKEIVNRAVKCQSCSRPFIAKDLHVQSVRPGSDATQPVFSRNVPNSEGGKVGSENINEKPASNPSSQHGQYAEYSRSHNARQPQKGADNVNPEGEVGAKPSRKAKGKRGKKQEVESSESFDSDSSLYAEEIEMNVDNLRAQRRSTRNKRHVSYNENGSDDDENVSPSKKAKGNGLSSPLVEKHRDASEAEQPSNPSKLFDSASASVNEGRKRGFDNFDGVETVLESMKATFEADDGCMLDSSTEATMDPTFHEYPDPEFCDFDKDREEHCFKVGQLWAVYDTVDAMPRFYARIRKIFSPGFKLRITWLEPDPDDDGREWACSKLPFSCGKFRNGNTENTEDRLMFSHEVYWDKGRGREAVMIYPKKGETWAIFKNWDAKWYLFPENERKFDYEFVEILREYDEIVGICVAHLGKLKGFASLFCRKDGSEVSILPSEILRFSHRVPSYRMTGCERNGVPPGSYELDPASITMNPEEISVPKQDFKTCVTHLSSNVDEGDSDVMMTEKPASSDHNNEKGNQVKHVNDCDGHVNNRDIPDSEFFNFDGMKSIDKFEVNQVWALYSDLDGLPKCYGVIKKIDPLPNFALHLSSLEASYLPTDLILWKDKKMPISCGQFKVKGGKPRLYMRSSSFSHQLLVDQKGKKKVYPIYPREGDVWALYKNWHPDMAHSELKKCEYDVVEVLEHNHLCIKVSVLEHVDGFNSVFKPQKSGSVTVTRDIPHFEMLRFSHQIPSFRLTDQRDDSLRGLWELDPAAFPVHLLCRSK